MIRLPCTLRSLAAALVIAACVPQAPEPPTPPGAAAGARASVHPRLAGEVTAVVPAPPSEVLGRAVAALRARGFSVEPAEAPGTPLRAQDNNGTNAAWAVCPRITTRDPMSEAFRFNRTEASDFKTVVTVSTSPDPEGGARVGITTLNIGTYVNSFTNAPQESPCRSTGVLERELLDAIRSGP